MVDDRQVGNMFGECYQYWQEGDQGYYCVDKVYVYIFEGGSKMYGIFLYMLCGVFDMVQMLLVGYIVFVYCCVLVEDVVVDEEVVYYVNNYCDDCDVEKDVDFLIKLVDVDFMWGGQCVLDQVVEWCISGVDCYFDFYQKSGDEDDE